MSDIIKYNPFKEISNLFDRNFFDDIPLLFNCKNFSVDIIDNGNDFSVIAELPGFEKENIEIDFSPEGTLTISCKKEDKIENNGKYYRKEIRAGSYSRQIQFDPNQVIPDQIQAEYKNGILSISIPKVVEQEKVAVKKIEIK